MKNIHRFLMYGIPKSLLFKIILLLLILLIGKNVFALDYNVTNQITSPVAPSTAGTYTGEEQNGSTSSWNVNTRYQGTLQRIRYNIPLPTGWQDGNCFAINNTYTITMEMATNDWRNYFGTVRVVPYSSYSGNWSNGRVIFVSRKKIYFTFTIPSSVTTCYDFIYVDLPSSEIFTSFTGETNWNLAKITLTDPMYNSSGSGSGSSGGTTSSNQDVIDNANQNTQDIINNQNNNTNNIIDNANQNTQDIINSIDENFKSCSLGSNLFTKTNINNGYYLNSSGVITSASGWFVTDYIPVEPNKTYEISGTSITGGSNLNLCFYTSSKSLISCIPHNDYIPPKQITTPNNAYYFADSVLYSDLNTYSFKKLNCSNKLDNVNDSINNVNDSINNDNVDSGTGSDFFNDFNTTDNGGISGIITKPLTLINSLLTNNDTCSNLSFSIQFPGLESKTVSFPSGCILWNNVPTAVVTLYHIFVVGFSSYYLLKRLFKDVEDLKNPEKDEVEVIDL